MDLRDISNVTDLVIDRLRLAPDHIAFETRPEGGDLNADWRQVSTREFMSQVTDTARGLMATGVQAGDHVLIMAPTCLLYTSRCV